MTPDHAREPRCLSCRHSTIIQGYAEGQRLQICSLLTWGNGSSVIPFPVYECSQYEHKHTLTLHQMNDMAKVLDNKNGQIGFRSLTREERGY